MKTLLRPEQQRSVSPHTYDKVSTATVRNILDLSTPEEYSVVPSQIFRSKDRQKTHVGQNWRKKLLETIQKMVNIYCRQHRYVSSIQ